MDYYGLCIVFVNCVNLSKCTLDFKFMLRSFRLVSICVAGLALATETMSGAMSSYCDVVVLLNLSG